MSREEFGVKYSELNNVQVTCPHCGKEGNKPVMNRFHFEFCKSNPDRTVRPRTARSKKRESLKVAKKRRVKEDRYAGLTRHARFEQVAKEFRQVARLFAKTHDHQCHIAVERLFNKAYSTAFLTEDEVIRAKMIFEHVPMDERPMLFRVPTLVQH